MTLLSPVDQLHEVLALVRVAADSAAASERPEIHLTLGIADEMIQEVIRRLDDDTKE